MRLIFLEPSKPSDFTDVRLQGAWLLLVCTTVCY